MRTKRFSHVFDFDFPMVGYSLGRFLRLQIKLASLLKPEHVRRCVEQLEEGRQRPPHETVAPAIDFLQNTRSMCAGDAQYLSLLRDLVNDSSAEAVRVIDEYIEELGDSRVDLQMFDISNDLNYWRDDGFGDPQAFRGMLMRLCDRIGPTNLRIMIATSPLDDGQKESVGSVEDLFDVLTSMDFVGPDSVQLLVDWSMELGLESSVMELVEYWSSTGELAESPHSEMSAGNSRSDINSRRSTWGVRLDDTTGLPPRSVRYADQVEERVSRSQGPLTARLDPLPASWAPRLDARQAWREETAPGASHTTESVVATNDDQGRSGILQMGVGSSLTTESVVERMQNETEPATHTAVPVSVRVPDQDQPTSIPAVTEQYSNTVTQQEHTVSKQMTSNRLYPSLEEFKETGASDEPKRKAEKRQLGSYGRSHAKRLKRENYEQPSQQETVGSDTDSSYESANDYAEDKDKFESNKEDPTSQIEEVTYDDQNHNDNEKSVDDDDDEEEEEDSEDEENGDSEEESGSDEEDEDNKRWKPTQAVPAASINKAGGFRRFLSGIRSYLGWK